MGVSTEISSAAAGTSADEQLSTGGAFGMRLDLGYRWPTLAHAGATHPNCYAHVQPVDPAKLSMSWSQTESTRIGEDRLDDGTLVTVLDTHPEFGFRFSSPHFGQHVVSRNGHRIRYSAAGVHPFLLERFIVGKCLPLAAILQGLEALHAGAAVIGDHIVACVGASGVGKSSVATQLILEGARFFADDVVCVARCRDELVAYPGSNALSVRIAELERLDEAARRRLGRCIDTYDGRAIFQTDGDRRALPLGRIYFLDRSRDWTELNVVEAPDSRQFLACTYDTLTRTPRRLVNLLDVCSQLALEDRLRVVTIPRGGTARQVAHLIRQDWHEH